MKNKRKIVNLRGTYQLLKPAEVDSAGQIIWHKYGKRKSLKAVSDIIEDKRYDFIIEPEVAQALSEYREKKMRNAYRRAENLELLSEQ